MADSNKIMTPALPKLESLLGSPSEIRRRMMMTAKTGGGGILLPEENGWYIMTNNFSFYTKEQWENGGFSADIAEGVAYIERGVNNFCLAKGFWKSTSGMYWQEGYDFAENYKDGWHIITMEIGNLIRLNYSAKINPLMKILSASTYQPGWQACNFMDKTNIWVGTHTVSTQNGYEFIGGPTFATPYLDLNEYDI
jgi:hypothetical protein